MAELHAGAQRCSMISSCHGRQLRSSPQPSIPAASCVLLQPPFRQHPPFSNKPFPSNKRGRRQRLCGTRRQVAAGAASYVSWLLLNCEQFILPAEFKCTCSQLTVPCCCCMHAQPRAMASAQTRRASQCSLSSCCRRRNSQRRTRLSPQTASSLCTATRALSWKS